MKSWASWPTLDSEIAGSRHGRCSSRHRPRRNDGGKGREPDRRSGAVTAYGGASGVQGSGWPLGPAGEEHRVDESRHRRERFGRHRRVERLNRSRQRRREAARRADAAPGLGGRDRLAGGRLRAARLHVVMVAVMRRGRRRDVHMRSGLTVRAAVKHGRRSHALQRQGHGKKAGEGSAKPGRHRRNCRQPPSRRCVVARATRRFERS